MPSSRLLAHSVQDPGNLIEAKAAGRLNHRLKTLTYPALLVVDEIGYLPVGPLLPDLLQTGLHLAHTVQGFVPLPLQRRGYQPVLRVDCIVLSLSPSCLVAQLLEFASRSSRFNRSRSVASSSTRRAASIAPGETTRTISRPTAWSTLRPPNEMQPATPWLAPLLAGDSSPNSTVGHVQPATAVPTQQQTRQTLSRTNGSLRHFASHLCVVGQEALIRFKARPVDVARVMLLEPDRPLFRVGPGPNSFASTVLRLGPGAPPSIGPRVQGVLQDPQHAAVDGPLPHRLPTPSGVSSHGQPDPFLPIPQKSLPGTARPENLANTPSCTGFGFRTNPTGRSPRAALRSPCWARCRSRALINPRSMRRGSYRLAVRSGRSASTGPESVPVGIVAPGEASRLKMAPHRPRLTSADKRAHPIDRSGPPWRSLRIRVLRLSRGPLSSRDVCNFQWPVIFPLIVCNFPSPSLLQQLSHQPPVASWLAGLGLVGGCKRELLLLHAVLRGQRCPGWSDNPTSTRTSRSGPEVLARRRRCIAGSSTRPMPQPGRHIQRGIFA